MKLPVYSAGMCVPAGGGGAHALFRNIPLACHSESHLTEMVVNGLCTQGFSGVVVTKQALGECRWSHDLRVTPSDCAAVSSVGQ